jgi:RsiW-degrading membrane proteinase PrsW (M82 family)
MSATMDSAAAGGAAVPGGDGDRRLAFVAGAGVVLSIAALVARLAGIVPPGVAAVVVLAGVTLALRVALSYAMKSASSPARTRVMNLVSTVGLSLSAVVAIAVLPHITSLAGFGAFRADMCAQLWTLAILTALAGPVRTLGWRALLGVGLTGFLALTGLARLVGRPVVVALGRSSLLATAVWVPVTEEIVKVIPLAVVIVLALRRPALRPSALDLMLIAAWTGAGFALYENAVLGRGGFHLGAVPLLSLFFPSETEGRAVGWTVVQTGHLVHTGLVGLGVGFALLYRKRVHRV